MTKKHVDFSIISNADVKNASSETLVNNEASVSRLSTDLYK